MTGSQSQNRTLKQVRLCLASETSPVGLDFSTRHSTFISPSDVRRQLDKKK
jgi:hypothetical protein